MDFKEYREGGGAFVDTSLFIEEFLGNASLANVLIRPHGYGKTMNLTMLRYFLDPKDAKENRELFRGLAIEKTSSMDKQGTQPLLFLSFADCKGASWEEIYLWYEEKIAGIFQEHGSLLSKLSSFEQSVFRKYQEKKANSVELKMALSFLLDCLGEGMGETILLLIDAFDQPLLQAYWKNEEKEALSFFETVYGSLLKGHSKVKQALMTGIFPLSFASVNNAVEYKSDFFAFQNYQWRKEELLLCLQKQPELRESLVKLVKGEDAYVFFTSRGRFAERCGSNEMLEFLCYAGYLELGQNIGKDAYLVKLVRENVKKRWKECIEE